MIIRRLISILFVCALVLIPSCSDSSNQKFPSFTPKIANVNFADFIGSNQCQACHADIYEQWKGSTHANAGGTPNSSTVIAPFNADPIILSDAIVFPEKINVTFAQIIDKSNIRVNVWERGAGLTKACGTAACATAVVLLATVVIMISIMLRFVDIRKEL